MKLVTDKSKTNTKKDTEKTKEEPSSLFQRQRVDMLLGELLRKFPLPVMNNNPPPPSTQTNDPAVPAQTSTIAQAQPAAVIKQEIITDTKPNISNNSSGVDFKPPEKRAK